MEVGDGVMHHALYEPRRIGHNVPSSLFFVNKKAQINNIQAHWFYETTLFLSSASS